MRFALLCDGAKNVGVGAKVRWVNVDYNASLVALIEPAAQRADAQDGPSPSILRKGVRFARVDQNIWAKTKRRERLPH